MTQRIPLRNISTVSLPVQLAGSRNLKLKFLANLSILCAIFFLGGCAARQTEEIRESVPQTSAKAGSVYSDPSLNALSQGLTYVREHPSTREDERIQRFLWLDQWLKVLQDKNRLSPEMAQEFWTDLVTFVKEPALMSGKSLSRVVQGSQTKLGRNIGNYHLYLALLKEQSLESALKNLEFVENDGVSDLYAKSQGLLQLFRSKTGSDSKKIGVLLPLTGNLRPLAEEVLQAIQVAGNLAYGSGTEFIIEDTGSSEADLLKAWDKLAVQEKVAAVIGPLTSKDSSIIFERAEVAGVPVISLAPKEGLEGFGNYSFQSVLSLEDQVKRISKHLADDLRVKRIAVLLPDSTYGWDVMSVAEKEFKDRGLQITQMQVYKSGATDFKDQLRRMTRLDIPRLRKDELCPKEKGSKEVKEKEPKTADEIKASEDALANEPIQIEACVKKMGQLKPLVDFEAIFAPDSAETIGFLLPTLPYLRIYGVQVVGLSQYNSPKLMERAGEHAEGVIFTDGYLPNSTDIQGRFLKERYFKVTQKEPSRLAAEAFDIAMIMIKTMREAQGSLTRDGMVERLRSVRDFPGVTGSIFYDNHKFKKEPKLLIVRNGAFQELRTKN